MTESISGPPGSTDPTDPVHPVNPVEPGPPSTDSTAVDDSEQSLIRSSAIMALGTVFSRITGFLRNLVLGWALGTALFADAFNLANTVPTSLYILIAGGALNAVFVPQLVRAMKHDPDGGEAFGQRLLTLVAIILLVTSAVAVLVAPWIIRAYADSRLLDPGNRPYFDLAIDFARYCLPQIFFYGLYVILGQILNARGRFGPMMWAPILNNLVSIAILVTFILASDLDPTAADATARITGGEKALLGFSSTVGVALQALCLIPVLRRTGFRLRPRFDFRGGGIGRSGRLASWTIGFVLINQAWFLAATRLTTGAGAEAREIYGSDRGYGLTPYLYAFLIQQLPHAVVTVSIVAALLPRMSRAAADNAPERVRADLSQGLRLTAVAVIPAAAAFLALGPDITVAMYFHGQISQESARFMGYVLMAFAVGLVGFSSQYIVLRGFYAYEDTRTPMFLQVLIVGTSVALAVTASFVLPVEWKTVGVAGAYAASYWLGFGVSLAVLRRRTGGVEGRRLAGTYLRAGAAAAVAGLLAFGIARGVTGLLGTGAWGSLAAVVVAGTALVGSYVLLTRRLRVAEVSELLGMLRARLR